MHILYPSPPLTTTGSLEVYMPLTSTYDARFKGSTRYEISLAKIARYSIHKLRKESVLGKILAFTEEADAITYSRKYFLPALSICLTEAQLAYGPNLPRDFQLAFSRTFDPESWNDLLSAWDHVTNVAPWLRWKSKFLMKELIQEIHTIHPHRNNIGLLRWISYGLFNCDSN